VEEVGPERGPGKKPIRLWVEPRGVLGEPCGDPRGAEGGPGALDAAFRERVLLDSID
jgi:hypothetical protein